MPALELIGEPACTFSSWPRPLFPYLIVVYLGHATIPALPSSFTNQNTVKMPVEITRMIGSDIDGAVDCIQKAFAEDPYFAWVFTESVRIYILLLFSTPNYTIRIVLTLLGLF
jgi:hypothetical protein